MMSSRRNSISDVYHFFISRKGSKSPMVGNMMGKDEVEKMNLECLNNYSRLVGSLETLTKENIELKMKLKHLNGEVERFCKRDSRNKKYRRLYYEINDKYKKCCSIKERMSKSTRMLLKRVNDLEQKNSKLVRRLSLTPPSSIGNSKIKAHKEKHLIRRYSDRFLLSKVNRLMMEKKMEESFEFASTSEEEEEDEDEEDEEDTKEEKVNEENKSRKTFNEKGSNLHASTDLRIEKPLEIQIPAQDTPKRLIVFQNHMLKAKVKEMKCELNRMLWKTRYLKKKRCDIKKSMISIKLQITHQCLEISRYMMSLQRTMEKKESVENENYGTILEKVSHDLGLFQLYETPPLMGLNGRLNDQSFPRKDIVVRAKLGQGGLLRSRGYYTKCYMSIFSRYSCVSFYSLGEGKHLKTISLKTGSMVEVSEKGGGLKVQGEVKNVEVEVSSKKEVFEICCFFQRMLSHVEIKTLKK